MADSTIDDILPKSGKPRSSLLDRPSVTADDFAGVIDRPSLVATIAGSLRDINGALDELTGKGGKGKNSGWRPSMMKQASRKLGSKNMMGDMSGIGENQEYDYSERNDDDEYFSDEGLDFQSLNELQKELDDADSLYSEEGRERGPSVIAGDMDMFAIEDPPELSKEDEQPNNFIDSGDKPAEDETKEVAGEETTASSDSESAGERVPPEIQVNSDMPKNSVQTLDDSEKENTENSQTKKEETVSDEEYEIGMQQVKYRALEEKMVASQAESQRMLQEQSQELEAEKEAKSMLELQLLKLQQDYDKLRKEKEELYKMNKVQQQSILDLMSKTKWTRWK